MFVLQLSTVYAHSTRMYTTTEVTDFFQYQVLSVK